MMKYFVLVVLLGLIASTIGDPDPVAAPHPDPAPDPDPIADPVADPDHYNPNAAYYNPRGQRNQPLQPPSSNYYPPPPNPYQQQPSYPPQPNPYSAQPAYPPYPYPPQPIQNQPTQSSRQGRVLGGPSNLNSVSPSPEQQQFFAPPQGQQQQPNGPPNQNGQQPNPFQPNNQNQPQQEKKYNKRYPLTPPLLKFKIGAIADLDQNSKGEEAGEFKSMLKEGFLYLQQNPDQPDQTNVTVEWNETTREIKSGFSHNGRGLELSTLNVFNGKVYSCDDHTGIVFEIPLTGNDTEPIVAKPWVILADGNATGPNPFKCEWATLKDGDLWVGGHGFNTLTEDGEVKDKNQKWVKKISSNGEVSHIDWSKNYDKIAEALEINNPGYVTHEAVSWSDDLNKWLFMPKKINKEAYTKENDADKGSDTVMIASDDFSDIQIGHIGEIIPERGFSGMKFVPGTGDQTIIALKTSVTDEAAETYIMAFDLKGNLLLNETKFADEKYQGIEFL